jgi:CBS domain-containing protein
VMREHSLRRLPVIDDGVAVGIITLGDLAVDRAPDSALGSISASRPTS